MVDLPLATSRSDPLAQPTRARLFEIVGELAEPVTTAELAERLGLHPNGVRAHLERLEREGLLERTRVSRGSGRPPDAWIAAPGARPGGRAPRAYADLGRWLARAIGPDPRARRRVEAAGREVGRELAPAGQGVRDGGFERLLARLGFHPAAQPSEPQRLVVRLGNCPYRDAVRENQDVVCALHRGITLGMLDVLDPSATLEEFLPRDPDTAGCLIEVLTPSP